ncbi:Uncharacterised protein [Corynebacterium imitans]|uniref:Uncharacterized protein n=2 Tax=Corynebacterium imitans TaxID=156978 RepID=A0A239ZLU1_9CORY|nr:Uncharacterised protein [Corynebacterium imitans]
MGDAMDKKLSATLSCLAIVGALAGCASDPVEPAAEVAEPEAPAFHFASGTLELGDFDPATLGDDLFDPCTEISADEFAAAGMTGVEAEPSIGSMSGGLGQGCRTDSLEPGVTRMILATRTSSQSVAQAPGYEIKHPESVVPGLYTHQAPEVDPYLCIAQVDTIRGGVGVGATISGLKKNTLDACGIAVQELEELFTTNGDNG